MKLILYSGGQSRRNQVLHQTLSDLVGSRRGRRSFTYIPFCNDNHEMFFRRAERRYRLFGFTDFHCLRVDDHPSKRDIEKALESDAVYLAGGNTFYFLKYLRKSGTLPLLRRFAEQGGVLAGLSAGALVMTPNIKLAGYPEFEADENEVKLKDLRALDLVDFEFYPHYEDGRRLSRALLDYSLKSKNPVIACEDGGGIVINQDVHKFLGTTYLFLEGRKIVLSKGKVKFG